jgi:pentatricopeptide repeat protein
MSTTVPNADITQSINPLLADLGASIVFGLGFYFFKKHTKNKDDKEMKDKLKPLKQKIEETINKWESSLCLQKINSIIKHEITDKNFDPFTVLDQLRNNNISPDISTINTLLDASSRLKDFKNFNRLKELIVEEEQALCAPNIVTFNIILKGINLEIAFSDSLEGEQKREFAKKSIEQIIREIERRGLKPNDITLNTIIDITVESACFDLAWKYYDDMEKVYMIEPDIYTYSTLLKTIKNYEPDEQYIDRAFEILKIVKLSKAKGIKPDEILYNCILDTCVKYNRMEQAESVYRDMSQAGVPPSKITYAIMIRGYGQDYRLEKAFEIFNEMKLNGVTPNEIIYGCLLNACVKSNKIERACEIYDEIQTNNVEMNLILYTTLIKGYTRTKNFSKAFEIYQRLLHDKSITPNIIAYNAILDSCVECGDYDMMSKIYEEIKQNALSSEEAPEPDLITYSTVIKGYSRMKNIERVMDIYSFLRGRSDMVLDEVIFNSILDGLLKSQKYDDALKIYEDMRKNNIKRSNATFSILIKIYSKMDNVEKAVEVYNEMIAEKMKPSLITYTSLLQIFIKSKRIQNAIELFDEILNNKFQPDQVMFNVIINGCVFNGKLESACKFLFESFKANIKLCNDVYKNILNNLLTNRVMDVNYKNDLALRVCKELKSRGLKIDYEIYYKVMKMIYRSQGKHAEQTIQREVDDYKKSVNESYTDNYDYEYKNYKNNDYYSEQKPRNKQYNSTNYRNFNNFNNNFSSTNQTTTTTNGNSQGKWRK